MIMPRAPGIEARHDGAEAVSSRHIGENMTAQLESAIVVLAAVIRVPQVDEGVRNRAAGAREHRAGEFDRPAGGARLAQVAALRRAGLEVWTFRLAPCRLVAIVTGRRRHEVCLSERLIEVDAGEADAGGDSRSPRQQAATRGIVVHAHCRLLDRMAAKLYHRV